MRLEAPVHIGDHEVQITGRIVRIILRGEFTEEHVRSYTELVDATIPRGTPYAGLVDLSALSVLGPAARRYLASWNKGHDLRLGAVIGASLLMRGALTLTIRAISLTKGIPMPLQFFSDAGAAEAALAHWQKNLKE